ncbi:hypothetical protein CB0940_07172 [Cercospora beticola]|uniref:Uncharacterized protein n=1 Tax=Cercospora beticola TaxID=122368 RepID=A0A2G5HA92_CERBT|nr:hypothetical protein CB0940_07172 [Cercospora beticola]PIA89448.1 hypothetical protein CB0940_07172 [Cercospora beticola]WPB03100.1 hypothetical protein RHO25_007737 [Cercospora beticola]CAK1358194.1 unnamed protein product [Cercospora beticola]
MAGSQKKDVNSSSDERGCLQPVDRSIATLQSVNKSESGEAILHGSIDQDIEAGSCNESIEPPNALARLMADHSDAEEDPMMMAQIGLVEDDWIFADTEEDAVEPDHYSSTTALVKPHEELDEFQEITDDEIKSSNDPAIVHDQHVRAMAYHVVPPYPIPAEYAIPPKPEDTSHAAQVRQYKAFTEACYPGNDEQREQAIKRANESFPRYGSPATFVRIVHVNGQAQEVSKWQKTKCDETCPMKKKSFLKKLAGVPGKLLSSMPYGKLS